ncbi:MULTISPECIES: flagellar motor protein MotB [Acidiphilium]|uniref:OmpA family protein n=1 Tax=Acidiphilium iwatense TaxID=768198 RepID=A0ABS9DV07_9PROT|nr:MULTISPECIES: flagellar motor protein MotB [Acidiphilium]MCF3945963.1 OmpA family protein [Acidiphilium iwatense]
MAGNQPVNLIIRKEEIVEGVPHGGAWKVAYADFVTAMMAFFLLMWLINATTEAQRIGLADYFSQANILNRGASGEGKPFGGHTPFDHGALSSDRGAVRVTIGNNPVPRTVARTPPGAHHHPVPRSGIHTARSGKTIGDIQPGNIGHRRFAAATRAIRQAIEADPSLRSLARQVSIHETPAGLKVQIMDTHKRPMFALGSAQPNPMTRALIRKITPILARLGNPIRISGDTDARPYRVPGHSNWDLSVDRANATRQLMEHSGLPKNRIVAVSGYADRRLLLPEHPRAAANRRIAILVLRPAPATGPNLPNPR